MRIGCASSQSTSGGGLEPNWNRIHCLFIDNDRDNIYALCGLDMASVIYVYGRSILIKSPITRGLLSVQQVTAVSLCSSVVIYLVTG